MEVMRIVMLSLLGLMGIGCFVAVIVLLWPLVFAWRADRKAEKILKVDTSVEGIAEARIITLEAELHSLAQAVHYEHWFRCDNCGQEQKVMIPAGVRADKFPGKGNGSIFCRNCRCEIDKASK